MDEEKEEEKEKGTGADAFLGGALNILGLQIDLGKLLESPEELQIGLSELRERLKAAGGKESLSDDEWGSGGSGVSGHVRIRDLQGEKEFHVGTLGKRRGTPSEELFPEPDEAAEPPVDVFDEGEQMVIVVDVPGVDPEDLQVKIEGETFSLSTGPTAARRFHKELSLACEVDPRTLLTTCRNGVLEARVDKK